jgi:hypothetical protein
MKPSEVQVHMLMQFRSGSKSLNLYTLETYDCLNRAMNQWEISVTKESLGLDYWFFSSVLYWTLCNKRNPTTCAPTRQNYATYHKLLQECSAHQHLRSTRHWIPIKQHQAVQKLHKYSNILDAWWNQTTSPALAELATTSLFTNQNTGENSRPRRFQANVQFENTFRSKSDGVGSEEPEKSWRS